MLDRARRMLAVAGLVAASFLVAVAADEPTDPDQMAQRAQQEIKAGHVAEATHWREKIAELQPENIDHWFRVGVLCWERSSKTKSMPAEERAALIQAGMDALDHALFMDPNY